MKELLASSRISYVGVSEELLDDYLAMVNDPEVGSLIGIVGPVGEAWERNWVKGKVEEKAPLFSMIEKETGTFIGNIELIRDERCLLSPRQRALSPHRGGVG